MENVKLTARERRFIKFASVEYDDQLYMTPQDFLESVVEQEPRRKTEPTLNQVLKLIYFMSLQLVSNAAYCPRMR